MCILIIIIITANRSRIAINGAQTAEFLIFILNKINLLTTSPIFVQNEFIYLIRMHFGE